MTAKAMITLTDYLSAISTKRRNTKVQVGREIDISLSWMMPLLAVPEAEEAVSTPLSDRLHRLIQREGNSPSKTYSGKAKSLLYHTAMSKRLQVASL
jgi:hypothetical protein